MGTRKELTIDFPKVTTYEGTKGVQKCKGLKIVQHSEFIDFYPMTEKGTVGGANIKIPIDDLSILDKIIEGLIALKDNRILELKGQYTYTSSVNPIKVDEKLPDL